MCVCVRVRERGREREMIMTNREIMNDRERKKIDNLGDKPKRAKRKRENEKKRRIYNRQRASL